jgi:hypothetical protein
LPVKITDRPSVTKSGESAEPSRDVADLKET